MYREDYARAGYLVLPSDETRERFVIWQSVVAPVVLFFVGLIPAVGHLSGLVYFGGALAIGGIFLYYSLRFALQRSAPSTRRLLLASILYLPVLVALLALDRK